MLYPSVDDNRRFPNGNSVIRHTIATESWTNRRGFWYPEERNQPNSPGNGGDEAGPELESVLCVDGSVWRRAQVTAYKNSHTVSFSMVGRDVACRN